jgi:type VI secretion system protein VasG
VPFDYADAVVDLVVSRCTETESGGRQIDAILTNSMLPELSRQFLNHLLEGKQISGVSVAVQDGDFSYQLA